MIKTITIQPYETKEVAQLTLHSDHKIVCKFLIKAIAPTKDIQLKYISKDCIILSKEIF